MNTTAKTPADFVTGYADKATDFYERLQKSNLIARNWAKTAVLHNFGLEYGEGGNSRKVWFHIEADHMEAFVHLAIDCSIGDYLLDRLAAPSARADCFPSRWQYGSVLGWGTYHDEHKMLQAHVTLRQFLLARQYDVPAAYSPVANFAKLLQSRGVSIPLAVAEQELTRVNLNRANETEPYILEENCSQSVGRGYGIKPKNPAGEPCEALTDSKKRKLYSSRFMHRIGWADSAIYVPASPERVMAMLTVLEEEISDGSDVSWALHPLNSLRHEGRIPLTHILESTVTSPESLLRFPSQDVFCLKWRMLKHAPLELDMSACTLGDWLWQQGYLNPYWRGVTDGSLKTMLV